MTGTEGSFDAFVADVFDAMSEGGAPYALIGGLALSAHGRPRATKDADILLGGPAIGLPRVFEALKRRGLAPDDIRPSLKELSEKQLTFLITKRGRLDIIRPALPLHKRMIDQALPFMFEGHPARLVRAEHLVVLKAIACRDRDKLDIADILEVQGKSLDRALTLCEAESVLPAHDPRMLWLKGLLQTAGR